MSTNGNTKKEYNGASENGQLRCIKCQKLLAKGDLHGNFEIKCLRCGTLNVVFEQMTDQVIITDAQGNILYINKAVENQTGFNTEQVIGKKPSDLWGGQMPKEFYDAMWLAIRGKKESFQAVLVNKKKSGELYNIKLVVSPILDTNGSVLFYVGTETVIKKI